MRSPARAGRAPSPAPQGRVGEGCFCSRRDEKPYPLPASPCEQGEEQEVTGAGGPCSLPCFAGEGWGGGLLLVA